MRRAQWWSPSPIQKTFLRSTRAETIFAKRKHVGDADINFGFSAIRNPESTSSANQNSRIRQPRGSDVSSCLFETMTAYHNQISEPDSSFRTRSLINLGLVGTSRRRSLPNQRRTRGGRAAPRLRPSQSIARTAARSRDMSTIAPPRPTNALPTSVPYLPRDDHGGGSSQFDPISAAVVASLDANLGALLRMECGEFWRHIAHDVSIARALDTYLRYRRRPYDDGAVCAVAPPTTTNDDDDDAHEDLDDRLARRVFMTIRRLATIERDDPLVPTLASRATALTKLRVVDAAKILDVCALFGPDNPRRHRRARRRPHRHVRRTVTERPRRRGRRRRGGHGRTRGRTHRGHVRRRRARPVDARRRTRLLPRRRSHAHRTHPRGAGNRRSTRRRPRSVGQVSDNPGNLAYLRRDDRTRARKWRRGRGRERERGGTTSPWRPARWPRRSTGWFTKPRRRSNRWRSHLRMMNPAQGTRRVFTCAGQVRGRDVRADDAAEGHA